jgi:dihydroorotate dehydrogenase
VYKGPGVVSKIRHELAGLMLQNGQRSIQDVVGLDHEDLFWRNREERLLRQRPKETFLVAESLSP